MKAVLAIALSSLVVAGCATTRDTVRTGSLNPAPEVSPQRGQTAQQQTADTTACEAAARDQTGYSPAADTAKGAGVGAVGGALAGAAAGAAIGAATGGDVGKSAGIGAGVGAAGGAVGGGAYKYSKERGAYNDAYARCMSDRGYEVSYYR